MPVEVTQIPQSATSCLVCLGGLLGCFYAFWRLHTYIRYNRTFARSSYCSLGLSNTNSALTVVVVVVVNIKALPPTYRLDTLFLL
ncbi:hypothetical protein QBC43DRAFT_324826, partial [Cladorrhinum sp. PSN259]